MLKTFNKFFCNKNAKYLWILQVDKQICFKSYLSLNGFYKLPSKIGVHFLWYFINHKSRPILILATVIFWCNGEFWIAWHLTLTVKLKLYFRESHCFMNMNFRKLNEYELFVLVGSKYTIEKQRERNCTMEKSVISPDFSSNFTKQKYVFKL